MSTHLLSRLGPCFRWVLFERRQVRFGIFISVLLVMMSGSFGGRDEVWAEEMMGNMPEVIPREAQVRGALAAFHDAWPEVQSNALRILNEREALGQLPEAALPQIGTLLKYPDDTVRLSAIQALGNLGARAVPFLPQIAVFLTHQNPELQAAAITAIGKSGKGYEGIYIPQLAPFLEAQSFPLRLTTLYALRNLDPSGQSYLPRIFDGLAHREARARVEAVMLLESLGKDAAPYVSRIGTLLRDTDSAVQVEALKLVGEFDEVPANIRAQVAAFVDSKRLDVRIEAIKSLSKTRPCEEANLQKLVGLLHDKRADIRAAAVAGMTTLSQEYPEYIHNIVERLSDHESRVRMAAIQALGVVGNNTEGSLHQFIPLLSDPEWEIRATAIAAVGRLGKADQIVISEIRTLLHDQDWFVRLNAIRVMGKFIETGEAPLSDLAPLLTDNNEKVCAAAIEAMGNLGERARAYYGQLIALLDHPSPRIRAATSAALRDIGAVGLEHLPALLQPGYTDPKRTAELRVLAYLVGAGSADAVRILSWIGNPGENYPDLATLSSESARQSLRSFDAAWAGAIQFPEVLQDMTRQAEKIMGQMNGEWQAGDIPLLRQYISHFDALPSPLAQSLKLEALKLTAHQILWHPIFVAIILGVLHPAVWLGLILAYPYSAPIRAIFFWNPYVRKIAGLWYIHVALVKFPGLRQRLFQPFHHLLLSDAAFESFDDAMYFKESVIYNEASQETITIHKAIPEIHGKIVLTGESGVGKTMFARYLMKYATRATVYLPAEKCAEGIIKAIQPKLRGEAQDLDFLTNLVRAGALDICVDGLDGLSIQHRAQVTRFWAHEFKGNILVTTRKTEWNPPTSFQTYQLQPLPQHHIEEFLKNCYRILPDHVPVSNPEYVTACKRYRERSAVLTSAQEVLTNPMCLTLIAYVLAYGKEPDVANLPEQVYTIMLATYQRMYHNSPFPLMQFAERVYLMRLNEEVAIPNHRFAKEIACMEQYKMVLSRHSVDSYGNGVREYFFRHEKIMEFFIAQALVNSPHHRIEKYRDDPRFRGVAALLKLSAAHEERLEPSLPEPVIGSSGCPEQIFAPA